MPLAHRTEKLERELVRELSLIILREINDPRMGFVTVMKTKLTADYKQATVFVSIMGQEKDKNLTFHGLRHAKGFIQKSLSGRLSTRYIPELIFELDTSVDKTLRMSALFNKIEKEREGHEAPKNEESKGEEE